MLSVSHLNPPKDEQTMNRDSATVLQFCQGRVGRLTLQCEHILICLFWPGHMACKILVPRPGIEPGSQQWKCWVLTTGLPWNSRCKQKRGLLRRTWVGIQNLVLSCFFPKRKGLSLTVPHIVNPPLWTEGIAMRTGSITHMWDLIRPWTMWEKSQAQDTLSAGTGDGRGIRAGVTCVAASWVTAEAVWFGGWRQWQPACQASPVGWF